MSEWRLVETSSGVVSRRGVAASSAASARGPHALKIIPQIAFLALYSKCEMGLWDTFRDPP